MKYNNIIFLGLCLGLTTYSALSADSVIKKCLLTQHLMQQKHREWVSL
ncbi:hypothetical protein BTL98_14515 [Escherichia coli]|nr:hypothetical protein [Escherichia coli]